jgi:hypothetical protein
MTKLKEQPQCLKIFVYDEFIVNPKTETKPKPIWVIEVVQIIVDRIVEFVSLGRSPNFQIIKLFPSFRLRNVLMAL